MMSKYRPLPDSVEQLRSRLSNEVTIYDYLLAVIPSIFLVMGGFSIASSLSLATALITGGAVSVVVMLYALFVNPPTSQAAVASTDSDTPAAETTVAAQSGTTTISEHSGASENAVTVSSNSGALTHSGSDDDSPSVGVSSRSGVHATETGADACD